MIKDKISYMIKIKDKREQDSKDLAHLLDVLLDIKGYDRVEEYLESAGRTFSRYDEYKERLDKARESSD